MASSSRDVPHMCQLCGTYAAGMSRCSGCKEVWYCSKEHQTIDWKKSHKPVCRYVKEHPEAVFVKVEALEGNGLDNPRTNYVFESKDQGLAFVSSFFGGHMSRPLRSQFAELMGWHLEIYCSTSENTMQSGMFDVVGRGDSLNGAGIYLGCALQSGFTRFNNLCGPIFVCGRRGNDGKPFTSDNLWGILNFLCDAMDLYGGDDDPVPIIVGWAKQYRERNWASPAGDGGRNFYNTDARQSRDGVESVPALTDQA